MFWIAAYICAYLSLALFFCGVVMKITHYKRNPMHLRWELYPVAHEARKAEYGGSYLEETDWVQKPRHKSLMGELRVMIPEIFFLKAVYESNRSLWFVSLPFHVGLYCSAAFFAALFAGAAAEVAGFAAAFHKHIWMSFLNALGLFGFTLSIAGSLGLIYRRTIDHNLRDNSSFAHYLNLGWFVVVMGLALRSWAAGGHSFAAFHAFAVNLVRFNLGEPVDPPLVAPVILGAALVAYIPWTHMAHFFMKYFLYHDIRWDDEPIVDLRTAEAKLRHVLSYQPTWAAEHIRANGKKTWADLASHNPAREQTKE